MRTTTCLNLNPNRSSACSGRAARSAAEGVNFSSVAAVTAFGTAPRAVRRKTGARTKQTEVKSSRRRRIRTRCEYLLLRPGGLSSGRLSKYIEEATYIGVPPPFDAIDASHVARGVRAHLIVRGGGVAMASAASSHRARNRHELQRSIVTPRTTSPSPPRAPAARRDPHLPASRVRLAVASARPA